MEGASEGKRLQEALIRFYGLFNFSLTPFIADCDLLFENNDEGPSSLPATKKHVGHFKDQFLSGLGSNFSWNNWTISEKKLEVGNLQKNKVNRIALMPFYRPERLAQFASNRWKE